MARSKRSTFDEDMRRIVAVNLGRALKRRGWTKTMLADKTGISSSTLSGYFTAKYNISEENLEKLAKAQRQGLSRRWARQSPLLWQRVQQ